MLRARRDLADGVNRLHLRAGAEGLRTAGAGSAYVLDRNAVSAAIALDRMPWDGPEVRAEYGADLRVFPDSSTRDHVAQHAEFGVRRDALGGAAIGATLRGDRRSTLTRQSSTRDRFWSVQSEGTGRIPIAPRWALVLRAEAELQRYDAPDSSLYFDYAISRASGHGRFETEGGVAVELGPRIERLGSGWSPASAYLESAGVLDVEWLGAGGLWSLSPAGGWREYDRTPDDSAGQSSYAFLEATVVADQALPGRLRVRLFGFVRVESHTESTENARSLYFSLDVRRVF